MRDRSRVVIVGASAAGLMAAEGLRRRAFTGTICLIGDEPRLPYDRPPLSKQFLSGAWDESRLQLRTHAAIDELALDLRLGVRATGLDSARRRVTLSDGNDVEYDALVVASGARPRLPAAWQDLAGVFTLRDVDDAARLRARLSTAGHILLVGAGFVGAEVAAVCRGLGVEVTMVEALSLPMLRGLGPHLARLLAEVHREHGVQLRLASAVDELTSSPGGQITARLAAETVRADVALVGLGAVPNIEWLAGSDLSLGDGLECDEHCRAADGIYGAGDVASWFNPLFGERMRIEHRLHASEQGDYVAGVILGDGAAAPFAPIPFFWSDQYDLKIQSHGRPGPDDDFAVIEGSVDQRRLVGVYSRAGLVSAVVGLNMPRQLRQARSLVGKPAPRCPGPAR